ncbi:MAG: hypothetical protein ACK4TA_06055 [Saprospiraceae bacterium]
MTVCYHSCVIRIMRVYALLLISFTLFIPAYLAAQTERGSWTIGGFVSYRTQRNPEVQKAFYVAPEFGYFPIRNLVVGLKPGLDITNTNPGTIDERKARFYILQPYARYFIGNGLKVRPFTGISYGLYTSTWHIKNQLIADTDGTIFEGTVGVILFLNKSLGIENAIVYRDTRSKVQNLNQQYQSGVVSFNVGINFFL